uniref:Polyamine oxidase n=1 Tax=Poecilia reticulata TaxID=8081 RepID=A0A3P9QDK9_POERE
MAGNKNINIVIVGSGIAGIAAAHRLVTSGFTNVHILEATERSGGRVKTGRFGDKVIEIGANWIHGPSEENPVFCLARHYGLLDPEALTPENQAYDLGGETPWVTNIFSSSGRKLSEKDIYPALEMFTMLLNESSEFQNQQGEPYASVGDFIRSEVRQRCVEKWKDIDSANRSLQLCVISGMLKRECCVNGSHSLDEVGLGAFGQYKTFPGLDCTFPGGYEGLIANLMSELPDDIVRYNRPVQSVFWSNTDKQSSVIVECEDGERMNADHVIVTVPLGYLKKHHTRLFRPPLPLHKLHSIQRLGFGTNNKIFVEFDEPWWDADCDVIQLVWEDEDTLVDQVSDLKSSWIKKLFGFTVLKPAERSSDTSISDTVQLMLNFMFGNACVFLLCPSGMVILSVGGSQDMSLSTWRRCLRRRSHMLSHNLSADSQGILPSLHGGSCAPSGSRTPGQTDLTATWQRAAHSRIWRT